MSRSDHTVLAEEVSAEELLQAEKEMEQGIRCDWCGEKFNAEEDNKPAGLLGKIIHRRVEALYSETEEKWYVHADCGEEHAAAYYYDAMEAKLDEEQARES